MKVLVTRTDRLGDLVLSLPVFDFIRSRRPDVEIHALVAPGSVPVVENVPGLEKIWTWLPGDACLRRDLIRNFSREKFDAVIMLQYHQELATLLKKSHIPQRVGPLSKFSSWFQLNKGLRQKRSRCQHHEMVYNLQLAEKLVGKDPQIDLNEMQPRIAVGPPQCEVGHDFRQEFGCPNETVVFVHPGSGGSALDWEPEKFAGVANSLASLPEFRVFVTGAGDDADVIQALTSHLTPEVSVLLDRFELRDFLGVLATGDLFIGPSTGPLHLAAALGLATVGIYPPVPTMSPQRWGPRGIMTRTVVPGVKCPSDRFCYLEKCEHHNCLKNLFERDVLDVALPLLKQKQDQRHGDSGRK